MKRSAAIEGKNWPFPGLVLSSKHDRAKHSTKWRRSRLASISLLLIRTIFFDPPDALNASRTRGICSLNKDTSHQFFSLRNVPGVMGNVATCRRFGLAVRYVAFGPPRK